MKRCRVVLVLAYLVFTVTTACEDMGDPVVAPGQVNPDEVAFTAQILPILRNHCSGGNCHRGTTSFAAGLSLEDNRAFASLVDKPSTQDPNLQLVAPGDADNSYVVIKIAESDPRRQGDRMPQGRSALASRDITAIRNWIIGLDTDR